MMILKRVLLIVCVTIILLSLGGFFYLKNKFTPAENCLTVSQFTQNIPIKWNTDDEDTYSAMYLPIQIKGINRTFYMQLDCGAPSTLFYKRSLYSIVNKFSDKLKADLKQNQAQLTFYIGNMSVSSDSFSLLDYGQHTDLNKDFNIIGTIGTDLLEKRVTVLDFKNERCSFIQKMPEDDFTDFEFKNRRIIIPATIENRKLKLLYDSGSSGYELITNKSEWETYRTPNGKITTDKGNSWGNTLTVISASANKQILFGNLNLPLTKVTYIEGISHIQKLLMKKSGMQGMIGNKIFKGHKIILDCKNEKYKIE
ncbi:hypothetical protein GR160_17585 [Flavobacterium sp. Sd200]|uniref:hypothetical protein n=1 Tax=Flavobacterium sp. Sd200 TaxID=2692211 RepID=UPI00136A389D|nr:hypothetical protein [Flavobacterium sp. Sd200]MXN93041.1 hypothetical protein [Flavobacterium sp. Sd200]